MTMITRKEDFILFGEEKSGSLSVTLCASITLIPICEIKDGFVLFF